MVQIIAQTKIGKNVLIRTVSLKEDTLYETVVFGRNKDDSEQYATRKQAEVGHKRWIRIIKNEIR